jgi:hypothetical protein
MKRATFFVLLLLSEHILLSQNLVTNPGFESWESETQPSGWSVAMNCIRNNSVINSGLYSSQHTGGVTTRSDLGQTFTVTPGKSYTLSYYNKTLANTGSGSRTWCDWIGSDGKVIDDPVSKTLLQPSKYLKNESWQQFTVNITAPVNASAFHLEVRTYANSIAYWDDFVFQETITTEIASNDETSISLYPNPVSMYLIIKHLHNCQYIDIQSLTGIIVWSDKYNGEEEVRIPVSQIPDGLYIIRIRCYEKTFVKKFVKKSN